LVVGLYYISWCSNVHTLIRLSLPDALLDCGRSDDMTVWKMAKVAVTNCIIVRLNAKDAKRRGSDVA